MDLLKRQKKVEGGVFNKLDSALYTWFRKEREKRCLVTGQILLEKASKFHHLIYGEHSRPFSASTGFHWRFCRRFGLRNLKICGEKLSADSSAANKFINEFDGLGYEHMDEQRIVALITGDNENEAD